MAASLDNRIAELETRLAFQEQALTELSDALAASRQETARAKALLERVMAELTQMRSAAGDPADEPPPPHY